MKKSTINKVLLSAALLLIVFSPLTLAVEPGAATELRHRAERKLTLTITPPIIKVSLRPGDVWNGSVKAINGNDYDIFITASTMNFLANDEEGHGRFLPLADENVPAFLASWIELPKESLFIPAGQSAALPFSLKIPAWAPPGGHYAAILIGPRQTGDGEGNAGPAIKVSSLISSLLFVEVAGNIIEKGAIKDFFSGEAWYQKPEAAFTLRFENSGNVHLLPQGEIAVYDMWGKKTGTIPINQKTDFGNVLPGSSRKFVFDWQGERGLASIGRYKAVATLAFGTEGRQNVSATANFWVLPVNIFLAITGTLTALILIIAFAIKIYVRRILSRYQPAYAKASADKPAYVATPADKPEPSRFSVRKQRFKWKHSFIWPAAVFTSILAGIIVRMAVDNFF